MIFRPVLDLLLGENFKTHVRFILSVLPSSLRQIEVRSKQ